MNFFDRLKEGEQYAVVSVDMDLFTFIVKNAKEGEHYMNHGVKTNNPKLKLDPTLKELYSEKSSLNRKILKREFEVNNQ